MRTVAASRLIAVGGTGANDERRSAAEFDSDCVLAIALFGVMLLSPFSSYASSQQDPSS